MSCKLPTPRNRTDLLVCLALVAVTLAVYWQVRGFDFVVFDDGVYVWTNQHVLGGLTRDSVSWAFSSVEHSNWHPLTWMSLMLDAQLGGGAPGTFHMTNVVLHVLNTLLLFAFLRRVTDSRWRSAAVAALFALHPLHVESVAWVVERKDVLSTFFWLLTMLAYVGYVRRPGWPRYALVVLPFALGLMAKPMLVSLPIVLLMMDFWPLKRTNLGWRRLMREKIPLFGIAAASCAITYAAQAAGGAVTTGGLTVSDRVANALISYAGYIIKMVYPLNLSVFYAYPIGGQPAYQAALAGLALAGLGILAVRSAANRPYITVGWLWYLVTLIPVIGLVQVGQQSMADRYTYVPLIGLFVVLAWGIPELRERLDSSAVGGRLLSRAWPVLGAAVFLGLVANTYSQVGYWRDSMTLYNRALELDSRNYLAYTARADAIVLAREYEKSIPDYRAALRVAPHSFEARYHYGLALAILGRQREAVEQYEAALCVRPDDPMATKALDVAVGQIERKGL